MAIFLVRAVSSKIASILHYFEKSTLSQSCSLDLHARSQKPVYLTSFLQQKKTLERIIVNYFLEGSLKPYPFYKNELAYRTGRSTDTAARAAVKEVESVQKFKQFVLTVTRR